MFSFVRFEIFRALRNVRYLLLLVVMPVGLILWRREFGAR
jgi:ABC-2 type transport system permease protein